MTYRRRLLRVLAWAAALAVISFFGRHMARGKGVREGVYALLLSLYLPDSIAVAVLPRVLVDCGGGDGLGLPAHSPRTDRLARTGGARCAQCVWQRPELLIRPKAASGGHVGQP
jgi:hypothetical protein